MAALPSEDEWRSWGFLERLDWCAQDVSKHGMGIPLWVTSLAHLKLVVANVLCLLIVCAAPPGEGLLSTGGAWQAFLRYTLFTHVLNALGEKDGPTRRWSGGVPGLLGLFCTVRYQLTPGTLKLPLFRFLGFKRTVLDVLVHVVFIAATLVGTFLPDVPTWLLAVVCACDVWFVVFDYGEYLRSHAPTYLGILFAACFPTAQGGRACAQAQLMIVWVGSGLAKVGPWFAGVNGAFVCGSYWLSGQQWLWRLMYRGEQDLRPTLLAEVVSHLAASVEWGAPLLMLFTGCPALVCIGAVGLVAMHLYIVALCIIDLHVWNFYCAVAAVYLFACFEPPGLDYAGFAAAPWPPLLYVMFQVALFFWGSLAPDQVNHQTAHRCWAGNWTQAVWLVRKASASKLLKAAPTYGLPPWDMIPAWVKERGLLGPTPPIPELLERGLLGPTPPIPELLVYKRIAFHVLSTLNMKYLPSLLRRAMGESPIADFHILHGSAVWDTLLGGIIGSYFNQSEAVLRAVQETAGFEEGECMCIWVGSFPAVGRGCGWGPTHWKIIDAKVGVVARGPLTVGMAKAVSSLPSACVSAAAAGALLSGEVPVAHGGA